MVDLFKRCLNATYIHTPKGGDYAIEVDDDTLYLLFECSDGAEDWLNNLDFLPNEYKDRKQTIGLLLVKDILKAVWKYTNLPSLPYKYTLDKWRVHGGFLRVWKDMQDEIEGLVEDCLQAYPEINKIVCVGYSHGAALSVLATEDMEYLFGEDYEVSGYGFGTPRVLWGIVPKEVKYRLRNFTSVRNIPDIVTHVPPMLFGFRNAGTLVKVGKKGKYSPLKAHCAESYISEMEGGEN